VSRSYCRRPINTATASPCRVSSTALPHNPVPESCRTERRMYGVIKSC
jgi:hypothetical protein